MKYFVSRSLLSLSVAFSLLAFLWARNKQYNLELVVLSTTIIILISAISLERWLPFCKDWNLSHSDTSTDIFSASVLIGIVDPLLKYAAPVLLLVLCAKIPMQYRIDFISDAMPFALQLILATALIEFGRYWAHRLHHSNQYLWWLHAMHHGSERLYALNNFRFHPLNYLINFCIGVLPAMLLGFDTEVLLGYLALTQPVLMLQHANIDLRNGWANYIFSSNELHRWHHSTDSNEANNNFGNAFVIWDLVFGTFKYKALNNPEHIGLFSGSSKYPSRESYIQQILSMFKPNCCP